MAKSFKSALKMNWKKVIIFLIAAFIFFFVVYWLSRSLMKNQQFRAFEPFEGGAEGKPAKTDAKTTTPPEVPQETKESFVDAEKKKEGFDISTLTKKFEGK